MYLLDTDVLSNLLKRAPSITLIAKLAAVPAEWQFTSSITLGELLYGARRRGPQADDLLDRIETRLLPELPVLPFDASAARRYGEVRTELERRGTPLGDANLRIAAIALARGLTVVTGNVRHFQRVPGLPVERCSRIGFRRRSQSRSGALAAALAGCRLVGFSTTARDTKTTPRTIGTRSQTPMAEWLSWSIPCADGWLALP